MSLRDFNAPSDDPIVLHNSPQGNGAGLGNFHTVNPEDREPNNTPKIVGALAVALMVGAAGIGLYAYSGSPSSKQVVTASNLPASSTPAPAMPAPAMPASEPTATPPEQVAQADHAAKAAVQDPNGIRAAKAKTFPAGSSAAEPIAPMKSASSKPVRSMASATSAPAETSPATPAPQQQAATVPQPVAPNPSPNDVASVNNQPITATPPTTASDVPAAPAAAPAQDQQTGAAAPPAQSAGQVNQ